MKGENQEPSIQICTSPLPVTSEKHLLWGIIFERPREAGAMCLVSWSLTLDDAFGTKWSIERDQIKLFMSIASKLAPSMQITRWHSIRSIQNSWRLLKAKKRRKDGKVPANQAIELTRMPKSRILGGRTVFVWWWPRSDLRELWWSHWYHRFHGFGTMIYASGHWPQHVLMTWSGSTG